MLASCGAHITRQHDRSESSSAARAERRLPAPSVDSQVHVLWDSLPVLGLAPASLGDWVGLGRAGEDAREGAVEALSAEVAGPVEPGVFDAADTMLQHSCSQAWPTAGGSAPSHSPAIDQRPFEELRRCAQLQHVPGRQVPQHDAELVRHGPERPGGELGRSLVWALALIG